MAVLDAHTGQVLALASSGTFDAAEPEHDQPERADRPAGDVGVRAGLGAEVDHLRRRAAAEADQAAAR